MEETYLPSHIDYVHDPSVKEKFPTELDFLHLEGEELKDNAAEIPPKMGACVDLTPEEAAELHRLLYKVLAAM